MERIDKYCNISLYGVDTQYWVIGFYGMLFHDDSQLLQCLVSKAGAKSWVHVFSEMVGLEIKTPLDFKGILWRTISLTPNMIDNTLIPKRFQTYTKFLFSRLLIYVKCTGLDNTV